MGGSSSPQGADSVSPGSGPAASAGRGSPPGAGPQAAAALQSAPAAPAPSSGRGALMPPSPAPQPPFTPTHARLPGGRQPFSPIAQPVFWPPTPRARGSDDVNMRGADDDVDEDLENRQPNRGARDDAASRASIGSRPSLTPSTASTPCSTRPSDQTISSLDTSVGSAGQLAARRQGAAGGRSADGGGEGLAETVGPGSGSRASGSGTSSDKRKIDALNLQIAEFARRDAERELLIKRIKSDAAAMERKVMRDAEKVAEKVRRDADKRVAAAEKRAEAARAKLHNERCRALKIRVSAYRARKALEHIHMRRPDGSIVRAQKVTVCIEHHWVLRAGALQPREMGGTEFALHYLVLAYLEDKALGPGCSKGASGLGMGSTRDIRGRQQEVHAVFPTKSGRRSRLGNGERIDV